MERVLWQNTRGPHDRVASEGEHRRPLALAWVASSVGIAGV